GRHSSLSRASSSDVCSSDLEIFRTMPLDGAAKALILGRRLVKADNLLRLQFLLDNGEIDHVIGVKRREPADEILELAHVARPFMPLQRIERFLVDAFHRQPLLARLGKEMADEIG